MSWLPISPLLAHAFGQTYNLPVPLWLFLVGGAAAVMASFVVASYFVDSKQADRDYPQRLIGSIPCKIVTAGRVVMLLAYLWAIAAGLVGAQNFMSNISPTLFWVLFLVGFAHMTILVGDVWSLINPLHALLVWGEQLTGKKRRPRYHYPQKLGYWPALAVYFGLVWLELLSYGWGIIPRNLSVILVVYGAVTMIGALLYGREIWFRYGDFFSVFFSLFGRLAILKYDGNTVYLRPPFVGLLEKSEQSLSQLLLILFTLSATAYDGLRETVAYTAITDFIGRLPLLSSLTSRELDTFVLCISPLVFLTIYGLFIWLMKRMVRTNYSTIDLAKRFSVTLLPIAIAYNVAHYFTLLVIQGQLFFKLISDPFGQGWNLLHTASYSIHPGVISAGSVWYIQVGVIIVGHIAAVYVSHIVALRTFADTKKAVLSQYPMLALMVAYTMTSLWIISQAIIAK